MKTLAQVSFVALGLIVGTIGAAEARIAMLGIALTITAGSAISGV